MNYQNKWQIGELNQRVIDLLELNLGICPIYIGDSNIEHMISEHPHNYERYGSDISDILNNPTYVSTHLTENDGSIHYVRVNSVNNDYIKVIVRPTRANVLFVRSLFVMDSANINRYWTRHAFKTY